MIDRPCSLIRRGGRRYFHARTQGVRGARPPEKCLRGSGAPTGAAVITLRASLAHRSQACAGCANKKRAAPLGAPSISALTGFDGFISRRFLFAGPRFQGQAPIRFRLRSASSAHRLVARRPVPRDRWGRLSSEAPRGGAVVPPERGPATSRARALRGLARGRRAAGRLTPWLGRNVCAGPGALSPAPVRRRAVVGAAKGRTIPHLMTPHEAPSADRVRGI
jgi:hypothetical protein